jgi:NADP-dependent 3-hydroxy acid dehydrogenase YdfG
VNLNSGLWGLVNNAGLSMLGDVELTTMGQFTKLVNINQLGMVRVTKAFLPAIRQRKGRLQHFDSINV